METTILQTDRLVLREFEWNDSSFIIELLNTPDWIKYIGDRHVKTEAQAIAYLENGPVKSYHENGFGLWLVAIKDTGYPVGACGILKREYLENPDIGFAFLPSFMNMGFAYEIATAVVEYVKQKFQLGKIDAISQPANSKSIRLLEKMGFQFVREVTTPSSAEVLHVYCKLTVK